MPDYAPNHSTEYPPNPLRQVGNPICTFQRDRGRGRYLLGPDAGFITGSDLLIDGGVIAAMRAGKLPVPV